MNNLKKSKPLLLLTTIVSGALLVLCSVIAGGIIFRPTIQEKPEEARQITSQVIVEKISSEAFVVTKTVFLDQKATIKIDKGSDWSNFWWGQEIKAEGLVRIDAGVDYSKLTKDQIIVDNENRTIQIDLPAAEILGASVNGDIEVETTNGLLRFLFANDPNQDFNLARQELIKQGRGAVNGDFGILNEARDDAVKVIDLVLGDLGYAVSVLSVDTSPSTP
ncbi:MAG: DUF4230 domain-containing protein [Candidatus Dojkabacteria bacterium]